MKYLDAHVLYVSEDIDLMDMNGDEGLVFDAIQFGQINTIRLRD